MADSAEHHVHHDKSDMSMYVLPLSILLAAVILGYSMMTAATALNSGILEVAKNAGTLNAGNAPLVPTGDTGAVAPAPTKNLADLSANAAATLGDDSAPITIVEFSDFQCPFCRRWFDDSKDQIVQKYIDTGKVKLVWKDFPLSFHPMSTITANAARCAGDQGKYWEFHDQVFMEQTKMDPSGGTVQYTIDDVKQWGKDIGLNTSTFNACVDGGTHNAEVQSNFNDGSVAGVSGTPSFFIGKTGGDGTLVVGAQPYATFEAAIESLLRA